jgi:hypothetical protein
MNPEQFRIFYNQTIHPELMRLDRKRRGMLLRMGISFVLMLGVVALVFNIGIFVVALLAAIPFVIHISFLFNRVRKFVQTFKPQVVKLVLDFIDDGPLFGDLAYRPNQKVSLQKFMASGLFGAMPAIYTGEDYIEGRVGDVEFEMSELNVKEFSRVRTKLRTVFRGIFLRAKFFHAPSGSLLVIPRELMPELSEAVKRFIASGGRPMDSFLRYSKFTDKYAVFASPNTKVNELLPKHLLNFILHHSEIYGHIYLSLFNQNAFVGITNEKDILEPKIWQSNVSFELVQEFYDDIYVALHIVQELDKAH